jgi:hypothetical protein
MVLKTIDSQHFYLNERLIDLVWIAHQVRKKTTAANYHEMHRSLDWLKKCARRLSAGEATPNDEATAKKMLIVLGYGWYFE